MAYRFTTMLSAAALALGCMGAVPALAQETATPSSPAVADKETSAKMHPMHHAAMHPHMHGKAHSKEMANGEPGQGVRSQDKGTDALNDQSLHAAQSNTAFAPVAAGAMPESGTMHGHMMHGHMMHSGVPGSTGGTMPAETAGTIGAPGAGNEGNGAMAGSSTGGVGGTAGTPMPKP